MDETKSASSGDAMSKSPKSIAPNSKSKKAKNSFKKSSPQEESSKQEVLLKLPGGFEYKMPGKRQRIVVASLVVGLNMLLLIAVALYFYVPQFKEFIYNVGR
ncbi:MULTISPECIES: hypothetical protein [Prochlorococcus]|uniref:hypothetical protein n=1 Tax=Prochlorococcus TaxID=1218 RepID=UPI000533A597|nr:MULTISPECIES: hypothetical protein [Prochlorococcus]KGG11959.1 hypothetical protein EV05_1161 [Prochlorococcus sp. MIT 0601]